MSTEADEKELEELLLRAEDLSGWCHWDHSKDPRKEVYKNFLRLAIQPLKEKIAHLESELKIAELGLKSAKRKLKSR